MLKHLNIKGEIMVKKEEKPKSKWPFAIIVIICLALISFILSGIISIFSSSDIEDSTANVAVIPVKGAIFTESSQDIFGSEGTSSQDIIEMISKAASSPNIRAVIFEFNSGGGSPVGSEEIANAIKSLNKTKIAVVKDIAASGAYWAASACDKIVASRLSLTGSVGVIGSYLEFDGLLGRYNVTYRRLVSGKYKDIGTPLRDMTPAEERAYQSMLDKMHEIFLSDVAENRALTDKQKEKVSEAMIYLTDDAIQLGLVDIIGDKKTAVAIIEQEQGITARLALYQKKKTLFDLLGQVSAEQSFYVGKGIGSELFNVRRLNSAHAEAYI